MLNLVCCMIFYESYHGYERFEDKKHHHKYLYDYTYDSSFGFKTLFYEITILFLEVTILFSMIRMYFLCKSNHDSS